jgi:hypothetical protein
VIQLDRYSAELRDVRRLIESAPEALVDDRLSELIGAPVVRVLRSVSRRACHGGRGGRLTVAAGQYLLWHFRGVPVPQPPDIGPNGTPFYALFALYWSLLCRKFELDADTAADLVRIDMASRGDTEPRHALMKLLERNFTPPAPPPLNDALRDWADELAVESHANFRKLAKRAFALAGEPT